MKKPQLTLVFLAKFDVSPDKHLQSSLMNKPSDEI